jgi:multidrug efflux pump subunit AcrB
MAITAEGFSYREMKDAAENLRKKLYQVTGVAKVELFGVQDERVWLEIDTRKLVARVRCLRLGHKMAPTIAKLMR